MARIKKEKSKHGLWKRLHFKYRLSVLNENTLEEVGRLQASIFMGSMLVLVFAITLITLTAIGIIATPIRNYLPGYSDAEVRSFALKNAILIDSLEVKLNQQSSYIESLHSVFQGKIDPDSSRSKDGQIGEREAVQRKIRKGREVQLVGKNRRKQDDDRRGCLFQAYEGHCFR